MTCPIEDLGLPNPLQFTRTIEALVQIVGMGGHVAIHCRASIGRSGMVASTLLGRFGHSAEEALKIVSDARGKQVPETSEQTAFVTSMIDRAQDWEAD